MLHSLPLRVLMVNFLVLALPLLVDSFLFFQRAYEHSIQDAKDSVKELANFRTYALSEMNPYRQNLLKELIVLLNLDREIPPFPSQQLNDKLSRVSEVNPECELIILDMGNDKGNFKVLASSNPLLVGSDFKSSSEVARILSEHAEGAFLYFNYSPLKQKTIPYLNVLRLINEPKTSKPAAILIIATPMDELFVPMVEPAKEREMTIFFALLTAQKVIFQASNPDLIGQYFRSLPKNEAKEIFEEKQLGSLPVARDPLPVIVKENAPFFEFVFEDQVMIAYEVPIPKVGFYFLAYTSKEKLFSRSIQHFLLIYTIYAMIFLLGAAFTYWLASWIARPLLQLCNLMEKVGTGNLGVRFKEEPLGFELNILGNIFNETLDSLVLNAQKAENERVLKETYKKELELGQEAQRSLLPQKIPLMEGIEVDAVYLWPNEVGGDFYDIFLKDEKRMVLAVADAAEKGITACLYALTIRSLMRTYMTLYDDVGEILSQTNNMFLKDTGDTGMFVTSLMGIYDNQTKIFTYFSCGHIPGLVRRSDGSIITLNHSGMALGLKEAEGPYHADSIELKSGDLLLLFTDGLVDATNTNNHRFSERRVANLLQQRNWTAAHEVTLGLEKEVHLFLGGKPQEEEIAILCVRVL